ncbi:gamma-glutamylcyclotransferase family protein [Halosolutus halophilus]|uniref:gamma-glutamylcyclotransferase family protein n=1 Tax=Halosolutus halophilus TaxID=1552990 RepID=UPI0022351712|nr:gamma-glutamylcyclotransferase family protein [Halosolutus halophilus]
MYVFVYGTLTDPAQVEHVLGPGDETEGETAWEFTDSATLDGFHRVDGRYPTLAPGGNVDGRLLAVDEAGLDRLDRYEGVDRGLYVRVAVPRSETTGTAWTYVGDPDRLSVDVEWPGDGSLVDRVQRYISTSEIVVESNE